jgi:hypothetical protein
MNKRYRELILMNLAVVAFGLFTFYLGTQFVFDPNALVLDVRECQSPADTVTALTPL